MSIYGFPTCGLPEVKNIKLIGLFNEVECLRLPGFSNGSINLSSSLSSVQLASPQASIHLILKCWIQPELQQFNGGEAFGSSSLGEISVSADKRPTSGPVRAPDQSSGKLKRVCRAKFVNTQQPLGTFTHFFGRLDLVPAVTQIVEACKGLPASGNRQCPIARQPIQGADCFDSGGPPDNLPAVDPC